MERRTVARWLLVSALACFGLLWAVGSAHAEQTVQGTQSSDGATAQTGTSQGTNSSNFTSGPSASGSTGANASQIGSNDASVSQSGTSQGGDPVAGAQVTGAVADDVTVQNQNSATDPQAITGGAVMVNDAEVAVGPDAEVTGTGDAQASQIGSNSLTTDQFAAADTGDAVSGSQVTGIVGGGEHTIQNQNTATCDTANGPCAATGSPTETTAFALNDLTPNIGPNAETPDGEAMASQVGDNDAVFTQAAEFGTGDALFGSQVNGVVGGSATVQVQNSATGTAGGDFPEAVSGRAVGLNSIGGIPFIPNNPTTLAVVTVGPTAFSGSDSAMATQNGDNSVAATQTLAGGSGDAIAGSQVTGAVGDQGGFLNVQSQQASEDNDAVVGQTSGTMFIGGAGFDPVFDEPGGMFVGPAADAFDGTEASASQIGNNDVSITQIPDLASPRSGGDALAGAQVTGGVGHTDVTVQNQNTASFNTAVISSGAGSPLPGTFANVTLGPAAGGNSDASASQVGDNTLSVLQILGSTGGDAVAGAQVTGVVATAGADVDVQNQNTATGNTAILQDSNLTGGGNVTEAFIGPIASALAEDGNAMSTQNGDNDATVTQIWVTDKGDAVAGAQVTGVVAGAGSDVTVQNQNAGEFNFAQTADVFLGGGISVPVAVPGNAINDAVVFGGPVAVADGAQASQVGDNVLAVSQTSSHSTGDAVANAQVTGVVAGSGSDVTVQNQNDSAGGPTAISGDIIATSPLQAPNPVHNAEVSGGPFAESGLSSAQATQTGDNVLDVSQSLELETGDAIDGAQVTGVVTGANSTVTVQNQNTSEFATAFSGEINLLAGGNVADVEGGPAAVSPEADTQASQNGDNVAAISQTAGASTGDAVAGAQVAGVVAGAGSDVTVQEQNTATEAFAQSGSINGVTNDLVADLGPFADSDTDEADAAGTAQAEQIGNNDLTFAQTVSASGGDAVAGAQVTGVVGPEDSTVQNQNTDDGSQAVSSPNGVNASNSATGDLSPVAFGADATTQQSGDSAFAGSQDLSVESGDAVAGAQINGGVGSGGAATTESTTLGEGALGVV